MKLEDQCCSLDLAKRLKELGVKYVEGHPSYYVSPVGEVYSTKYKRICKLSRSYDNRGYWKTFLSVKGKPKAFLTHRLVAKAFVPNPNKFPQVNHKDGNKNNNHFSNLEWCTKEFNERHKRIVLGENSKGEKNGHWGYSRKKMYPSEVLRNRLCELGIPRYKHDIAELGEMLPRETVSILISNTIPGSHSEAHIWVCKSPLDEAEAYDSTEANVRARMLIHLLESNLLPASHRG